MDGIRFLPDNKITIEGPASGAVEIALSSHILERLRATRRNGGLFGYVTAPEAQTLEQALISRAADIQRLLGGVVTAVEDESGYTRLRNAIEDFLDEYILEDDDTEEEVLLARAVESAHDVLLTHEATAREQRGIISELQAKLDDATTVERDASGLRLTVLQGNQLRNAFAQLKEAERTSADPVHQGQDLPAVVARIKDLVAGVSALLHDIYGEDI